MRNLRNLSSLKEEVEAIKQDFKKLQPPKKYDIATVGKDVEQIRSNVDEINRRTRRDGRFVRGTFT
jgi:hypothetical protein